MRLLMLIIDETRKEELEALLQAEGVPGYTEIPHALGVGSSGPRLGSRAFPKTSAVIIVLLAPEVADQVVGRIKAYCRDCGEHLRMFMWSAEELA
jgi:hypothetical protein